MDLRAFLLHRCPEQDLNLHDLAATSPESFCQEGVLILLLDSALFLYPETISDHKLRLRATKWLHEVLRGREWYSVVLQNGDSRGGGVHLRRARICTSEPPLVKR